MSLFNSFKYGIRLKTVSKVYGTASVSVLNYFGLLETEKELFLAIIPDYLTNEILIKVIHIIHRIFVLKKKFLLII